MSIPDFIHHFATFNPLPPLLSQSQRCAKITHYRCQSALVRLHRTHLQAQDEMWEWKEMEGCVERNLVYNRMPSECFLLESTVKGKLEVWGIYILPLELFFLSQKPCHGHCILQLQDLLNICTQIHSLRPRRIHLFPGSVCIFSASPTLFSHMQRI